MALTLLLPDVRAPHDGDDYAAWHTLNPDHPWEFDAIGSLHVMDKAGFTYHIQDGVMWDDCADNGASHNFMLPQIPNECVCRRFRACEFLTNKCPHPECTGARAIHYYIMVHSRCASIADNTMSQTGRRETARDMDKIISAYRTTCRALGILVDTLLIEQMRVSASGQCCMWPSRESVAGVPGLS